jgi:asparagine synthase (glutamine-hydrolysing)
MRAELKGPTPREVFEELFERPADGAGPDAALDAVMTYEWDSFLKGLLIMEDKVAMAHGLETRVPFLDNALADFAARLPARLRVAREASNNGRSSGGKRLLRRAVAGLVPPEILARDKQGFSAPDASWFKGQSIDYVRARVGSPRARIYGFLDFATVDERLQEHFAGVRNHRLLIWSLLHLEQAMETWRLA